MFPETPLPILVELYLAGAWVDISTDVRSTEELSISRGRADEAGGSEPSRCQLTLNNAGGKYSPRNPASPYFGLIGRNTQLRVSVTTNSGAVSRRFTGEVSAWPPRWTEGHHDAWVPIEVYGILRRLGQSTPPLHDALRRHTDLWAPLAYWPMTDGETSLTGTEVAARTLPIRNSSFAAGQAEFGKGSLAPWLDAVAQTPSDKNGSLYVAAPVTAATDYAVDWAYVAGAGGSTGSQTMNVNNNGEQTSSSPYAGWSVQIDSTNSRIRINVQVISPGVNTTTLVSEITPAIFDGALHHVRLALAASGTSTAWKLYVDGKLLGSGTHAVPLKPLGRLVWAWTLQTAVPDPPESVAISIGHITFWGAERPEAWESTRAMQGHARERAGRRIERVCAEEGVPLRVTGSLDNSPEMGPQRPGALLELLASAVDVDGGVLGEARDELALAYRTNRSRYNQGVEA